jgi:hypothetical protein
LEHIRTSYEARREGGGGTGERLVRSPRLFDSVRVETTEVGVIA